MMTSSVRPPAPSSERTSQRLIFLDAKPHLLGFFVPVSSVRQRAMEVTDAHLAVAPPSLALTPHRPCLTTVELKAQRVSEANDREPLDASIHLAFALAMEEKSELRQRVLEVKMAKIGQELEAARSPTPQLLRKAFSYLAEKADLAGQTVDYLSEVIEVYRDRGVPPPIFHDAVGKLILQLNLLVTLANNLLDEQGTYGGLNEYKQTLLRFKGMISALVGREHELSIADQHSRDRLGALLRRFDGLELLPPMELAQSDANYGLLYTHDGYYATTDDCLCYASGAKPAATLPNVTASRYQAMARAVLADRSGSEEETTAAAIITETTMSSMADIAGLSPREKVFLAYLVAEGCLPPCRAKIIIDSLSPHMATAPHHPFLQKLHRNYQRQLVSVRHLKENLFAPAVLSDRQSRALASAVARHGQALARAAFKDTYFCRYRNIDGLLRPVVPEKIEANKLLKLVDEQSSSLSMSVYFTLAYGVGYAALSKVINHPVSAPVFLVLAGGAGVFAISRGIYSCWRQHREKRRYPKDDSPV